MESCDLWTLTEATWNLANPGRSSRSGCSIGWRSSMTDHFLPNLSGQLQFGARRAWRLGVALSFLESGCSHSALHIRIVNSQYVATTVGLRVGLARFPLHELTKPEGTSPSPFTFQVLLFTWPMPGQCMHRLQPLHRAKISPALGPRSVSCMQSAEGTEPHCFCRLGPPDLTADDDHCCHHLHQHDYGR